jgi:chromosome segregation and condensation protein ScpB
MTAAVEALLFVSAEPLGMADLRRVLAIRQPTLDRALDYLGWSLAEGARGISLQRHAGVVRLVYAHKMAHYTISCAAGSMESGLLQPAR